MLRETLEKTLASRPRKTSLITADFPVPAKGTNQHEPAAIYKGNTHRLQPRATRCHAQGKTPFPLTMFVDSYAYAIFEQEWKQGANEQHSPVLPTNITQCCFVIKRLARYVRRVVSAVGTKRDANWSGTY